MQPPLPALNVPDVTAKDASLTHLPLNHETHNLIYNSTICHTRQQVKINATALTLSVIFRCRVGMEAYVVVFIDGIFLSN